MSSMRTLSGNFYNSTVYIAPHDSLVPTSGFLLLLKTSLARTDSGSTICLYFRTRSRMVAW